MKKQNTNGFAGGEKGWQIITSNFGFAEYIGVQKGYDASTCQYLFPLGIEEDEVSSEFMWDSKEEAIQFILDNYL